MKLLVFYTLFNFNLSYGDFCAGWDSGYKNGYCYRDMYCIPPIPPICPIPRIGEDSYSGGYSRGFIAGLNSR